MQFTLHNYVQPRFKQAMIISIIQLSDKTRRFLELIFRIVGLGWMFKLSGPGIDFQPRMWFR